MLRTSYSASFSVVVALLVLNGCAAMQYKREVTGNRFVSTHPKMVVSMPDDYKYLGKINFRETREGVYGTSLNYDHDYFVFGNTDGDTLKKGIFIFFSEISNGIYPSDFYSLHNQYAIVNGTNERENKYFQYFTQIWLPTPKNKLIAMLLEKGIKAPCGLVYALGRIMGTSENLLFQIWYYESLDFNKVSCFGWKKFDDLNDEKKEYFNKFLTRYESAFDIKM